MSPSAARPALDGRPAARRRRASLAVIVALLLLAASPSHAQAPRELRFATILPSGSAWMLELRRLAKRVSQRTRGELRLRFFPDAIMGDERDVVQKMDRDQLHGAAVTTVGLGLLVPWVRVFELPLLFQSTAELDAVRGALTPDFEGAFRHRGYLLLGWGDVGWVRLFTTHRLRSIADLPRIKIWSWIDDPVARALVRRFGARGVPLAIQDVLPALETGLINACYGSPYTMLALQWHTKVHFLSRENITYAVGALVVRRRAVEKLPATVRQIFEEESRAATRRFVQRARQDNQRALTRLRELQILETPIPSDMMARLRQISRPLWNELAGQLYPRELLERVLRLLAGLRR